MVKDSLGDRMKEQYENRTRYSVPRRTYTMIRVDGKAFHSYTRGCERPFDDNLIASMDNTAKYLCENIQGAKLAYVQSDEISVLVTDFDEISTESWFNGNLQKMVSISAALATAAFNREAQERLPAKNGKLAMFDARVFTIPDPIEVCNYFVWRQKDATRNSVQMVAQSMYSQKELNGKKIPDLQELIFQKGVNWNDYGAGKKRGRVVMRGADGAWFINQNAPIFTQERDFLRQFIPVISFEEEA